MCDSAEPTDPPEVDILIRPARLEDADTIAGLLEALNWVPPKDSGHHMSIDRRVVRKLSRSGSDGDVSILVATDPRCRLTGFVAVTWISHLLLPAPEGYISELVVDETLRGRGIGSRLLSAAQEQGRRRGCVRLMLLNNRGRESYRTGFYKAKGWIERNDVACFNYPLN